MSNAFAFSALFTAGAVAASFDAAIQRDASNGRINAQLSALLSDAWGFSLPAKPLAFAVMVNDLRKADKMATFTKGVGMRTGARQVHEALASLYATLYEADKVKGMPALAAAPAWLAAPVRKAKADKADTAEAGDTGDTGTSTPTDSVEVLATPAHDALAAAVAMVLAACHGNQLSDDQRTDLLEALVVTATPITPAQKAPKRRKTAQDKADNLA